MYKSGSILPISNGGSRDRSGGSLGPSADRVVRDAGITDVRTTVVDGNYPWILVRVSAGAVKTGDSLVPDEGGSLQTGARVSIEIEGSGRSRTTSSLSESVE